MHIERLRIKNFRSFREVEIALPSLSVVVGSNASGKSNFVQLFRFLRDLAREGLDNAVALQGSIDYLRNLRIGHSEPLEIAVSVSDNSRPFKLDYELRLVFFKRKKGFRIEREAFRYEGPEFSSLGHPSGAEKKMLQLIVERQHERMTVKIVPEPHHRPPRILFPDRIERSRSILPFLPGFGVWLFAGIAIYDLNPKTLKQATPLKGRASLEEDGSNLAVVLREILRHKESRQELLAHLQHFLPFIEDIRVQSLVDRSLFVQMYERYLHDRPVPSTLLSDGTIELVALTIALYFMPGSIIVLEEPDRNLHPILISRLMEMFQEVSRTKQVIFTTHNPEVVRHTPLESLLLVSRDGDGFSIITRPAEQNMVKTFLEQELGLEELFVENLLGA